MKYVYRCKTCKTDQEIEHSIKDDPVIKCQACEGDTQRVIQRTSFVLGGDGWARDGYKY